MATTPRWGFRFPVLADTADVPRDIQNLATDLDGVAMDSQGTLATRPGSTAAAPGKQGRYYFATDTGKLYRDTGTAWVEINITTADGPAATATLRTLGIGALQATAGNDARLADQRVPSDNSVTGAKVNTTLKPSSGAGNATETLRALGSSTGTAAAGDDARLANARTPLAHQSSHMRAGGADLLAAITSDPGDGVYADADLRVTVADAAAGTLSVTAGSGAVTDNGTWALAGERIQVRAPASTVINTPRPVANPRIDQVIARATSARTLTVERLPGTEQAGATISNVAGDGSRAALPALSFRLFEYEALPGAVPIIGATASHRRPWANSTAVILTRDTPVAVASGGWSTVPYTVEQFDPDGMHDLVTNPTRITIPFTGLWLLSGRALLSSGAGAGTHYTRFVLNGANFFGQRSPGATAQGSVSTSLTRRLVAGDFIEYQVWNGDSVAQNVQVTAGEAPEFSAVLLAP